MSSKTFRPWPLFRPVIPLLAVLLLAGTPGRDADAAPNNKPPKVDETEALFNSLEVLRVKVEIPDKGWKSLRQEPRESVLAMVREGGRVYTNVSIHLKGAAGSFRPVDDRPALTLNFDKAADGQKFHGLEKLSLNNSVQDPTYTAEKICRELFLAAGVPVPRAAHATVELNGRDLGLYVLVEGWNKQFLKRHFKNTKGNLYDGGFVKDIDQELSVNSGDNPQDQSPLKTLAAATREPDRAKRLEQLNQLLDVDRFITFLALDVILWDWDGYGMNRNNYRVFHDMSTGKLVFMPHGLDQMFWRPDGPILPPMNGMVARAVIEIPELRKRYFDEVNRLLTQKFNARDITNRVNEIATHIRPAIKERDPEDAKRHEEEVAGLCSQIAERWVLLSKLADAPAHALKFGDDQTARIEDWKSHVEFGKPEFLETNVEGSPALAIQLKQGSSIGEWRAKVLLEGGRYKAVGRVKTTGVTQDVGDRRGGATLRVSGGHAKKRLLADTDWEELSVEFFVSEPASVTDVICELRGARGEALFDRGSLRLIRLPER